MRFSTGATFLLLVSATIPARSQDAPPPPASPPSTAVPDQVDDYVRKLMAKRHVPGASIVVIRDGKVVLEKGYGQASVELDVPASPETVYQLASVTKPFTASAIMLLVRDGKVGLDDRIADKLSGLPKTWDKITVRHLLGHTSGIKNLTERPGFGESMRKDFAPRELIETVAGMPLDFPPGEKWDYSNTNYILLGMLIEAASGQTYGEFMAERLFKPLGMTNTRANDLHAVIPGRAQGYSWNGKELRIGDYHSASQPFAAGMLVSTVADLVKWDAALDSGRILTKDELDRMWSPTRLDSGKETNYGLGWEIGRANGHRVVSHGGGIPGFSTQLSRFPDDKLTVIILTNLDGGQASALARGIAARFVPELAEKSEVIEDRDPALTERIRRLFERAQRGEIDEDQFTDEAKKQLVPHLRDDKDRLASLGALRSLQPLERKEQDDGVFLRYRATFEKETLRLMIGLDKAGKVRGLGLQPED